MRVRSFGGARSEQIGIIEFLLPNSDDIAPNTQVLLELYDSAGKVLDGYGPGPNFDSIPPTDNQIIISGYVGDGEATITDRNIDASQITTFATDAGQRLGGPPYLVDVTNFVTNSINSGEEIIGFRLTTNENTTLEALYGPNFINPIRLIFQESANLDSLTVNTTGDEVDPTPGDENLDVDPTKPGQQITLRSLIDYANNNPGLDKIRFDIPTDDPGYDSSTGTYKIEIQSALPMISDAIDIDGQNIIELKGNGGQFSGLTITAGNSTVQNLTINNFGGAGIPVGR